MDTIINYISAHPSVITVLVIFVVIILLYFIFKQFIKLFAVYFNGCWRISLFQRAGQDG